MDSFPSKFQDIDSLKGLDQFLKSGKVEIGKNGGRKIVANKQSVSFNEVAKKMVELMKVQQNTSGSVDKKLLKSCYDHIKFLDELGNKRLEGEDTTRTQKAKTAVRQSFGLSKFANAYFMNKISKVLGESTPAPKVPPLITPRDKTSGSALPPKTAPKPGKSDSAKKSQDQKGKKLTFDPAAYVTPKMTRAFEESFSKESSKQMSESIDKVYKDIEAISGVDEKKAMRKAAEKELVKACMDDPDKVALVVKSAGAKMYIEGNERLRAASENTTAFLKGENAFESNLRHGKDMVDDQLAHLDSLVNLRGSNRKEILSKLAEDYPNMLASQKTYIVAYLARNYAELEQKDQKALFTFLKEGMKEGNAPQEQTNLYFLAMTADTRQAFIKECNVSREEWSKSESVVDSMDADILYYHLSDAIVVSSELPKARAALQGELGSIRTTNLRDQVL